MVAIGTVDCLVAPQLIRAIHWTDREDRKPLSERSMPSAKLAFKDGQANGRPKLAKNGVSSGVLPRRDGNSLNATAG